MERDEERIEQPSDDPLLSVTQVARHYGVGTRTVVDLVAAGDLRSLDRGRLVAEGHLDVPVVRLSWAEAIRVDSPGAGRRVDQMTPGLHPAAKAAIDFQHALQTDDAQAVFRLSSAATQISCLSPSALAAKWRDGLEPIMSPSTGIASGVYSLAPIDAVAVRVILDGTAVPTVFKQPTPVTMATALPLVAESGEWKLDYGLWQQQDLIQSLLSQAPPGPSEGGETADGRAPI